MKSRRIWGAVLVVLAVAVFAGAGAKVAGKAAKGKTAFVRWMGDTGRLARGETIYGTDPEGYPNLPMAALFLLPFHSLGPMAGSMAWLVFKCLLIVGILVAVQRCLGDDLRRLPGWFMVVLFVLSARVFVGDLTHGNINLVIGALIAGAMVCSYDRRDFVAGFLIGFAGVLKVTPMLFAVYYLYKRRWQGLLGVGVGVLVFLVVIPSLALGIGRNLALMGEWYVQMVDPFVSGAEVGYMQTRYDNQSLTGLVYRLFTDSLAIPADPDRGIGAVNVSVFHLGHHAVVWILRSLFVVILGVTAWMARTPRALRQHAGNMGEFAMVFLAMLFLSERSWKHHYVLLILGHAFVLWYLLLPRTGSRRLVAGLFAGSVLCHWGFGSGVLGHRGSDLAEAYGIYLLGGLLLYGACACVLYGLRRAGFDGQPRGACQPAGSSVA